VLILAALTAGLLALAAWVFRTKEYLPED